MSVTPQQQMSETKPRWRRALSSLKPFKNKTILPTQEQSALFNLPPEIREKIWDFTLSPSQEPNSPHFHIYDEVYDSCLYRKQSREWRHRRENPVQIGLLLTCRAAYNEAKLFLYKDTKFTLVLFAGNPRGYPGRWNCVGTVEDCSQLFRRMKDVTLVVQPGKRPDAEKYAARVAQVLEAVDYFKHADDLRLYFNFHAELFQFNGAMQRFETIIKAFYPLNRHGLKFSAHLQQFLHLDDNILDTYTQLLIAIAGPDGSKAAAKAGPTSNRCVMRGVAGWQPGPSRTTSKWEYPLVFAGIGLAASTYLATLPVSIPYTYLRLVKRKADKGEDNVWQPWKIF